MILRKLGKAISSFFEWAKSFLTHLDFSRTLKIKLLLYFIPMIIITLAVPQIFISVEKSTFNNLGVEKMIDVTEYIGYDFLNEYTKSASLFFDEAATRLNVTTQMLLQAYTLRTTLINTSPLNQELTTVCTFDNYTSCMIKKYEDMNLNTVVQQTYNREKSLVNFTTTSYQNYSNVDTKSWLFIQSFKSIDSYLRGTVGRIRGDSAFMTQVMIFYNSGNLIASYPAMNIAEKISDYSDISSISGVLSSSSQLSTTYITESFYDLLTSNIMLYLVRGLQMSDDTEIQGGIALGIILPNLFETLLGNSLIGETCSTFIKYLVASDGTILYISNSTEGGAFGESKSILEYEGIARGIAQDIYDFMTSNTDENSTFSRIYDQSKISSSLKQRFPLIFARLLSTQIKYLKNSLYLVSACDVTAIENVVSTSNSETSFLRDFHWILDIFLFLIFGFMLISKVELFTKEILSPIKQISAKFIEITQSAFNYQELREISFEDILIREDTEIKDFHNCACDSFNALMQDKNFLNEGEFQEHKNIYKNKVLKKIYEEKNVLKPIKAISHRIPDKINLTNNSTQEVFLENMPDHMNDEPNITVNSRIIM